ncbi:thioredoxin family protein [Lutibacter profundi]|uniref:thioredoxin family protein n=1 Tax=Lutibacter profundi TaxID=1622118 RepID=UPI000A84B95B|nr:thioredoxin family protein [Lutibacter profundi]
MIDKLINDSLKKGISYASYRSLIKDLLTQKKSTGKTQTEAILNFSILNDRRMDRLDKTLKVSSETLKSMSLLENKFTFLVIAEGWCGDAAQILPILNKIAETSPLIDLKIVLRDENPELMNQFLTNGNESIPKIIIIDSENSVINSWGPRPMIAAKMVIDYKEKNGRIDADLKKNLQLWYNKDKGINTQEEIIKLLKAS